MPFWREATKRFACREKLRMVTEEFVSDQGNKRESCRADLQIREFCSRRREIGLAPSGRGGETHSGVVLEPVERKAVAIVEIVWGETRRRTDEDAERDVSFRANERRRRFEEETNEVRGYNEGSPAVSGLSKVERHRSGRESD